MLSNIWSIIKIWFVLIKYDIVSPQFPSKTIFILCKISAIITYPIFFRYRRNCIEERLSNAIASMGPIYIKFGQTLSTCPDIVGEKLANAFKRLQDKLPPFGMEFVAKTIKSDLQADIDVLFVDFNEVPVAAASVAQVHKAVLHTGEIVAVKILRPSIVAKYSRDIFLFYLLAKLVTKFMPRKSSRLRLTEVVDLFHNTMKAELDLRVEASACSEMREQFLLDETVYIPKIFWNLTTENVLTMEWIDGVSIYDRVQLAGLQFDLKDIAAKLAVMFFNQAYKNGFFHADLHPGNILIGKDGKIVLLDFGIMGRLPKKDRFAVAEILHGFLTRDYMKIAHVHKKASYIPQNTDLELFARSIRMIGEQIVDKPLKNISVGRLLSQLFKITEDFGMHTQPQLLLLQKTTVVVESIGKTLDQDINMWKLAYPWIKRWAMKNISPEAKILRYVKVKVNKFFDKISEEFLI